MAFRPNKNDTTGLSVLRELFSTAQDTLTTVADEKRHAYCVVRLAVADLTRLGLTVVPEPEPAGPPGHAVIPELSWQAYHANKDVLKDVQLELALLASQSIVLLPTPP